MRRIRPYLYILLLFLIPLISLPFIFKTNLRHKEKLHQRIVDSTTQTLDTISPIVVISGNIDAYTPVQLSDTLQIAYKSALYEILETSISMLNRGDSAQYVVVKAISMLENNPIFFYNTTEKRQAIHSATIMTGHNNRYGTVLNLSTIKNPIKAAYQLLVTRPNTMLSEAGAISFAQEQGLKTSTGRYFTNEHTTIFFGSKAVTCLVYDKYGNTAAGLSTVDKNTGKGQIKTAFMPGTGIWAENGLCAFSCIGNNSTMETCLAHEIAQKIKYKQHTMSRLAREVVYSHHDTLTGKIAITAIDAKGDIVFESNHTANFIAFYDKYGRQAIKISQK